MVVKEFSETPWLVNKVFVRLSSRTVDTLLTFWFCAVMFSQVAESRYRSADPRNVNRLDHPPMRGAQRWSAGGVRGAVMSPPRGSDPDGHSAVSVSLSMNAAKALGPASRTTPWVSM